MSDNFDSEGVAFYEDMTEDGKRIARTCMGIRQQNANIIKDIEKLGGDVDVSTARLEHLLQSLVDLKILQPSMMWEIQLDWEKRLRSQLGPIRQRLQELDKTPRPKATKKLWLPDQRG